MILAGSDDVPKHFWYKFVADTSANQNEGFLDVLLDHLLNNLMNALGGEGWPEAEPDPFAELTEHDRSLITMLFDALDEDNSELLDKDEVLEAVAGGDGEGMFIMCDTDEGGFVDRAEFDAFFLNVKQRKGLLYSTVTCTITAHCVRRGQIFTLLPRAVAPCPG